MSPVRERVKGTGSLREPAGRPGEPQQGQPRVPPAPGLRCEDTEAHGRAPTSTGSADTRQGQEVRRRRGQSLRPHRRQALRLHQNASSRLRRPKARPRCPGRRNPSPAPRSGPLAAAKNTLAQGASEGSAPFYRRRHRFPERKRLPAGSGGSDGGQDPGARSQEPPSQRSPTLRPHRRFTANTHTANNQH